jgi:hypothetical protein
MEHAETPAGAPRFRQIERIGELTDLLDAIEGGDRRA